jgi:hypothetical protein
MRVWWILSLAPNSVLLDVSFGGLFEEHSTLPLYAKNMPSRSALMAA